MEIAILILVVVAIGALVLLVVRRPGGSNEQDPGHTVADQTEAGPTTSAAGEEDAKDDAHYSQRPETSDAESDAEAVSPVEADAQTDSGPESEEEATYIDTASGAEVPVESAFDERPLDEGADDERPVDEGPVDEDRASEHDSTLPETTEESVAGDDHEHSPADDTEESPGDVRDNRGAEATENEEEAADLVATPIVEPEAPTTDDAMRAGEPDVAQANEASAPGGIEPRSEADSPSEANSPSEAGSHDDADSHDDAEEDSGPEEFAQPFGPGSASPNDQGQGPSGWQITGNTGSMLFHTPDSPSYDTNRADVWFDSEESARAAGFAHWDRKRR